MLVDVQVEHDQLVTLAPRLVDCGVRILVDHCGRPTLAEGLGQPGFRALLALAGTRRAFVKLSGFVKFSREPAPHADAWPFVRALVDAFGLDRCLWASDWPYLRAPLRVDYGVLLQTLTALFPQASQRRTLLWDTPRALLGFGP
jgi:predicted TIM-barrel fold metal-dependent hydrolase